MKTLVWILLFCLPCFCGLRAQETKSLMEKGGKPAFALPDPTLLRPWPELSFGKLPTAKLLFKADSLSSLNTPYFFGNAEELPMNQVILSGAYRPFYNPFTPMLRRLSPYAFDFNEASVVPMGDHLSLLTIGRRDTWPLLGGVNDLNARLVWRNKRLTISGGIVGGAYFTPMDPSSHLMFGTSLHLRYDLNERLAFNAWGQYNYYSPAMRKDFYLSYSPFYETSGFGASLEYMLNDHVGLGGGVESRFNYLRGRMEYRPIVYPIFKIGKVKMHVGGR
jgi:hypothetical protein